MKRVAASIVAGLFAVAPIALAAERPAVRTDIRPVASTVEVDSTLSTMTLAELFASVAQHTATTTTATGMIVYDNPVAEVVVARRSADGTVTTACVETEEAAREFLYAKRDAAGNSSPEPK
jgi:hypothetical protein